MQGRAPSTPRPRSVLGSWASASRTAATRRGAAPEPPRVPSRPDDAPVAFEELPDGVTLTAPADAVAGTQRHLVVRVAGPGRLTVEHRGVHIGDGPQRLAAWAITMVPVGGR